MRIFAAVVTVVALAGNFVLHRLMYPSNIEGDLLFAGSVITVSLALPISFFIGLRMQEIYRLTVRLEAARDHDPLTGALTREAFYRYASSHRRGPATLIVADVDHFKAFNDRYGHPAGDAALRHVVDVLSRHCRQGDLLARFGGEEFLLLMPGTTPREGQHVAERLCEALRNEPAEMDGEARPVTASFGVAAVEDPRELTAAIERADVALYAAKRAGRNCVRQA
ncbi:hypothetical protein A3731_07045 [Roseovarius sp. HI0049]|nr:hypothetical protein A3731_07045 [Roseovarius sp. HI0049]